MSQQELADKAHTTFQNISKLEREGVKNIDDIKLFSRILGTNLLEEEIDVEGSVGEIGMEILIELVKHHGYIGFGPLLLDYLHGMSQEQATKEVKKLSKIGACHREVYTGFDDIEKEGIFLTAKGLIIVKNRVSNPLIIEEIKEDIEQVITYEEMLQDSKGYVGDADNYQDYFDRRPYEKS